MNKNTVISLKDRSEISDPFSDLLRSGARLLIEQAIELELQEMLSQYTGKQTDTGHAVVVRNGYLPERAIQTGIGPVTVKVPRIRSRSGEAVTFRSALVPPYIRKTRSLESEKLCALVIIGVNARGEKHFLAGTRESTQSWREVLLKLKSCGMNSPELAVGDGAMGFRAALEEIYPDTRQQRCWMHKTCNVLNALPKSLQPKAKKAVHEI